MGARVKFGKPGIRARRWGDPAPEPLTVDVKRDRCGKYFEILEGEGAPELELLQGRPKERHLLLYTSEGQRFLCGHDERHWFVAGIAGAVSTVRAAKQSLMPREIAEQVNSPPPGEIDRRRNAVFKRQGEWFFVPVKREIPQGLVLKNERLQRTARSKPHICEELYREGGELVYLVGGEELTEEEYWKRKEGEPDFDAWEYRTMVGNPAVYVRGCVRHDDHATLKLAGWHRVFINGELTTSPVVSYLD